MIRLVISTLLILVLCAPLFAQELLVEIIFGPRDGDNVGTLYVYLNTTVTVDLWIRTAPGISIQGMHLPLSSKDDYMASRDGGRFYPPVDQWPTRQFNSPNDDPNHDGYTNQGILGVCTWGGPVYNWGIHTEGEWMRVACYLMTPVNFPELNTLFCDAFIEGSDPINGGIIIVEYQQPGEIMDPSMYEVQYACLEFRLNECGDFIVGDFNGSLQFNVADIVSSYSRLATGSPNPALQCECPPGSGQELAAAMDVNNTCAFNIADVVVAYQRLSFGQPEFQPCQYCPPAGR